LNSLSFKKAGDVVDIVLPKTNCLGDSFNNGDKNLLFKLKPILPILNIVPHLDGKTKQGRRLQLGFELVQFFI
jgi:hypothetical protein